jgi:hypothetical protein
VSESADNKTPTKRVTIELSLYDNRKESKNCKNKHEGEFDDDKVTLDGAAAKKMEFVENPKEVEGGEGGYCRFCEDDPCVWLSCTILPVITNYRW